MKALRASSTIAALAATATWIVIAACGEDSGESTFHEGVDSGSVVPDSGPSVFGGDVSTGPYEDFPKDPVIDGTTPANAAELFANGGAGTDSGSGPCLLEPEIGSLVPQNWLRPRFRWVPTADADIFEIRVHADNQSNDLVVYTTSPSWTMPTDVWNSFRVHAAGVGINISVRGGKLANGVVSGIVQGSSGAWSVAPVDAPGSIVYWHIIGDPLADLKGFRVGDESVTQALDPASIKQESNTQCVGCHISSPDGKYAIVSSRNYGGTGHYGIGIASIEPATRGDVPPFLTSFGRASLETYLKGVTTAATPFWQTGKHLVVGNYDGELRWVNLDATDDSSSKGAIAVTGDPHTKPNTPNLSHDGTKLVYVSGDNTVDGRPAGNTNDIYMVPFNNGAGGVASPLQGAATAENEYYPSFSPDDKLVAFNRVAPDQGTYSSPTAEVYVVPASGGTAQRLAANDPPACSGVKSPGVENSWPRWAPGAAASQTVDGKTYYWLVFSSTRLGGKVRQLFMAPVVVDANGAVSAFKAVYLWNQPADESNHTPAWDVFAIPPSGPK